MTSWLRRLLAPPAKRPSLGQALFPLLVGGGFGVFCFFLLLWPDLRVGLSWAPVPCTVLEGRIGEAQDSEDGTLYRAEVRIRYDFGGVSHEIWSTRAARGYSDGKESKVEALASHPPGDGYTCWVNPENPAQAVVLRGVGGSLPLNFVFISLVIALAGARNLWYWRALRGKSREEIAHLAASEAPPAPWLPALTTLPGKTLAHRLPMAPLVSNVGVTLFGTIFLVFGLGAAGTGLSRFFEGAPNTLAPLLIGNFSLLLACVMLADVLKKTRVALTVPATAVEISTAPVRPGQPFDLHLEQSGPADFLSYTLSLVCEEAATYTVGTESTTKTHVIYSKELFSQAIDAGRHQPFVRTERLTLRRNTMHSFEGKHNKIRWKVVIHATTPRGLAVVRELPLAVHPPKPRRQGAYREAGRA